MEKEKLIQCINDILYTQSVYCTSIDYILNNCTIEKEYLDFIIKNKENIFVDNFNIYTFDYSINNNFLDIIKV